MNNQAAPERVVIAGSTRTEGAVALAAERNADILRRSVPPQIYPPMTELFSQDGPAEEIYVIEQGLVKLCHLDSEGKELIVGLRSSGALLGSASVILKSAHPVSAVTLTRCRLLRISADDFVQTLERDVKSAWCLHEEQSREIHYQIEKLVALGCLSARRRLEQLLRYFISTASTTGPGNRTEVRLPLRHWEIAQLISITPQHLSKVVKQMQAEGIIRWERGHLIISAIHKFFHPVGQ